MSAAGSLPRPVIVTAGPTREFIDPVRFLSNPSSGAMGIQVAAALHERGARVILVLGPTHLPAPPGVTTIRVVSARDMARAVLKHLPKAGALIATAAVSDWRVDRARSGKMKKGTNPSMALRLIKNPDILGRAGEIKAKAAREFLLVGFALETGNLEAHARKKLREKNLDLIIANRPDSFGRPRIRPLWIERRGAARRFSAMTKKELSSRIATWTMGRLGGG